MLNKSLMCLLLLSALLFSGCIITGKVTDGNGNGIEGVTVTLTGGANSTTTTNSKGGYSFGNFFEVILNFTSDDPILIMPGSYTVTPSKTGYTFTPTNTNVSVTTECYGPLAADLPWPVGGVNFEATGNSPLNVSGVWNIYETVYAQDCGEGTYTDDYQVTVTQTGSSLTVQTDAGTFNGSIIGNSVSWSGTYYDSWDEGWITLSTTLTVSNDGNSLSGQSTWQYDSDYGSLYDCSGTTDVTGTKT